MKYKSTKMLSVLECVNHPLHVRKTIDLENNFGPAGETLEDLMTVKGRSHSKS
ncbi:hypothetical protein JOC77_003692 [Peribacillus deserti]|uniref:Uncharacterized protein n=1 Tax=Peribacillus deserti TaxID=673318 RepID=A0ABS2QM49_9BACI|nr:hypothetical protein [Peribacillus deserti]